MVAGPQQTDLYSVLGVPRDAKPADLENAYYRLHRQHPPQKDPEKYRRIRFAFDTLYDPAARRHYDALWAWGDQVRRLVEQAIASMEADNCLGASRHLTRLLTVQPAADEARDLLGICQREIGLTDEAIGTYSTLLERRPDVPVYWTRFGDTYIEKAEKIQHLDKGPLIGSARYNYRKAIKLDPKNTPPYLAIARTYIQEEKYDQALTWAEKALTAHKQVDIQHFDALFCLCHIHIVAGQLQKAVEVGKRIESLIPNETDIKLYTASMFGVSGLKLLDQKAFDYSNFFLKAAVRFDPKNADLTELQQKSQWMKEADQAWRRLEQDEVIIHPVKALAALTFVHFTDQEIDGGFDRAAQSIKTKMDAFPPDKVRRSVEILITEYPQYHRLKPGMWNRILGSAREASGIIPVYTGGSGSRPPLEPSGSAPAPITPPLRAAPRDWPSIFGATAAVLFAIIGFFLVPPGPMRAVGAVAGVVIGWYVGITIGRLF